MSQRTASYSGRLWLALRLPDLPANALAIDLYHDAPLVIIEQRYVVWANTIAVAKGVMRGMDASTAQLLSGCVHQERQLSFEQSLLAELSAQLYAFTPYIETYTSKQVPQSGLLLEISSCLMLFGGARAFVEKIVQFFAAKNVTLAIGLAHSAQAAWLLSFVHYDIHGAESKPVFVERLQQLPIQLLHDYPAQVDALEKTGFVTFGDIARQIAAQSISSIKKRFGHEFAQTLCDIFGIDQDFQQSSLFEKPVVMYKPQEFFSEEIQFEYPINQVDQLQAPVENLLQQLADFLRKRQWETHQIEWTLADIYHSKEVMSVYADTAQSHWQLFFDLTLIQLENRDLPFEVDTLALSCRNAQPIQTQSQLLAFDSRRKHNGQAFTTTAAKLKARMGDTCIYKLSYRDSYIPEDSNQRIALNQSSNQQLPDRHLAALRPSWLFKSPIEIEVRQRGLYWRGYLTLLAGPERLQGNWWKAPSARDYFLAQRNDYVRLWVFRDLHKKQWYVQGIYG
ncbi:MAG: DNA polymerase Y family protein [Cellvibrio sp.]|uniref:Y-family DNA polymerase n=1 Tax=Cellvibrio sp. TaxID=1965322 RepID=UPI0031ADF592